MRNLKEVKIRTHLKEASNVQSMTNVKQFKVVLIKEGLGNLRDCFYYTKQALQDAAASGVFEGKKCYADHPTSVEEQIQPERSTRDIIGYFENVQFEEMDGQGMLTGILCVSANLSNEWALSLLTNSLEYAKKYKESDFVGLSINANGEATSVPLDEFLQTTQVSDSVLPKLNLAKQEGITEIRPVSKLTEAVSCDLVTEAGAGGTILSMIEGDKKRMKQKKHEDESKMKHAAPPVADHDAPMSHDDGSDGDHADADQDKALFAKMIKQYLGDEHPVDEDGMMMAKHAYEAHKQEGMDHEAAYEAAGKHLKMALAIGKKMSQKQGEKKEASEKHEDESHEQHEEAQPDPSSLSAGKKKESAYIALTAKVARLEERVKTYELRDYLDQKMSESKKPNSVTKKFREALGAPKSKAHIDDSWKFFVKAYEAGSEEVASDSGFVFTEKKTFKPLDSEGKIGSLADCLE